MDEIFHRTDALYITQLSALKHWKCLEVTALGQNKIISETVILLT